MGRPGRLGYAAAGLLATLIALAACGPQPSQLATTTPTAARTTTAHASPGAPNIVFVLTDDLSDNLVAHMPQVRSLEQNGTSFTHYYVVDSLCCPSRAAIFTSEFPHNDGVYTNTGRYGGYRAFQAHNDGRHSFARSLRRAGYTTAFMGKYLNGYGAQDPVARGWDVWDGVGNGGYSEFNYTVNANGARVHFGGLPSDYLTDVLSARASSFIASAAQGAHPFFLEVATFAPHAPFVPAPKYIDAAAGELYPKTPAYGAQVKHPPPWLRHRHPLTARERQVMLDLYRLRVEDDYSVDDLIANIRAELATTGLANNTYIVFSSDNGYHMGEHRLLSGKQTAFDTDINVPLVITGPRVPVGATVTALASSVDLGPTFEALAHADVGRSADGVSLLPILSGQSQAIWQRAVLVEHHGHDNKRGDPDAQTRAQGDPPSYEAVRTLTGLYVRYAHGATEYYDTRTDPYELDNLGGDRAPPWMKRALRHLATCRGARACQRAAIPPFG